MIEPSPIAHIGLTYNTSYREVTDLHDADGGEAEQLGPVITVLSTYTYT